MTDRSTTVEGILSYLFTRVVSRFGILVWYRLVFSWYFPNRYQRKTRQGPSVSYIWREPLFCSLLPPFCWTKPPFWGEFPQNFTKWSSGQILQYKKYRTYHTEYQPASAGNLSILAKLPVNRWDTTLLFTRVVSNLELYHGVESYYLSRDFCPSSCCFRLAIYR